MQIPILNGIYANENADFRTSLPLNLMVEVKPNGISNGYLRPAYGLKEINQGDGFDRGGIEWNGICYRVSGTKLIKINEDGTKSIIGDVSGSGFVKMAYSFDRLAIASGGNLFYYNGSSLTKVTDSDLGTVLDVDFIDGYFLTTDGTYIVQTELLDPTSVDPLKYGSSEDDPDPITAIRKVQGELYVSNRYTTEVFTNTGGSNFAFSRVDGALVLRGAISASACSVFDSALAFVGGGKKESLGVFLCAGGQSSKISSSEIDRILAVYPETELAKKCKVETMFHDGHQFLFVHLPDQTLLYDKQASIAMQEPVWVRLSSSIDGVGHYRACGIVWCYNKWIFGDPYGYKIGEFVDSDSYHFGEEVRWEFSTGILYNESKGFIFHELELVCLGGRVALQYNGSVSTCWSSDGETFSQPLAIQAARQGERTRRLRWIRQGMSRNWRIQKFFGTSGIHTSFVRLEARVEGLNG